MSDVQRPSDIAFAAARSYGAYAADEPDPQRRCELYMGMLKCDLRAIERRAAEDHHDALRIANGWTPTFDTSRDEGWAR